VLILAGCSNGPASTSDAGPATAVADLRADVDRDGTLSAADEDKEDQWGATRGAIFLANLDDDTSRCPTTGTDVDLAACSDASDDVVNGLSDLDDMAPLAVLPWPDAPEDATATLELLDASGAATTKARVFRGDGADATVFDTTAAQLTAADLRAGVSLHLEGTDVVRDLMAWDGTVDVRLTVRGGTRDGGAVADATDTVRLRVAPVVLSHHVSPAERIWVSKMNDPGNAALRADLATAVAAAKPKDGLTPLEMDDQWTQDLFETGWASMPAPGKTQRVMRYVLRSANVFDPGDAKSPLRPAGQIVYSAMRGPDVAVVQEFDIGHSQDMDSLNSFGNTETIPPHENAGKKWPLGRIVRGSTKDFFPDPKMSALLEGQRVQSPLYVDTSWLLVGHVDESLSFLPAPGARGWVVLAADPAGAKKMLEQLVTDGQGATKVFAGLQVFDAMDKLVPAETTVSAILADTAVMGASAEAAVEIDAQKAKLVAEVGLADADFVKASFLFEKSYGLSIAYQPGVVNGTLVGPDRFASPKPHGPVVMGKDVFEKQLEDALQPLGVKVSWVEDWDLYHRLEGEVHCGSNATRAVPDARWWEVMP
jgi:protein-arginine deiminase